MKYIEKYNRYIDDDCVIYRMNKEGKLVQVKPSVNNCGYEYICYDFRSTVYVHRLVYEAFKGEITEGLEIDHIDRNKRNNNPDNLRLVNRFENMRNVQRTGLRDYEFGKKFKAYYGEQNKIYKHPAYKREWLWYTSHNKKCRWEK